MSTAKLLKSYIYLNIHIFSQNSLTDGNIAHFSVTVNALGHLKYKSLDAFYVLNIVRDKTLGHCTFVEKNHANYSKIYDG